MQGIAVELFTYGMIKLGRFKLSSGLDSPFYIDLRKLYSYPDLTIKIVDSIVSRIQLNDIDIIAGLETAGIPLAAYMACRTGKPMVYVRKEKKNHGTGQLIEGEVSGRRILVVDDVVTTGSTLLRAIGNIMNAGGNPIRVIVLVDREQGAREKLTKMGIELYAFTTASQLFRELYEANILSVGEYQEIVNYIETTKRID